jgi:hypothetical protein
MSVCVIPGRHARLRLPTGLHHAIITLPKPKKSFNPVAGSEPTAYAATGTGSQYVPDEK